VKVEVRREARETAPEAAPEAEPMEEAVEEVPQEPTPAPATVAAKAAAPVKDRFTREIEAVLSEDLTDLFLKLPPEKREAFRLKGEETASKVRVLLSSAKVNVKKILLLIVDWLKMIPGVNKFFLEQEAKIKADKLLLLAKAERAEGANQLA
jgi:hypothetical protein